MKYYNNVGIVLTVEQETLCGTVGWDGYRTAAWHQDGDDVCVDGCWCVIYVASCWWGLLARKQGEGVIQQLRPLPSLQLSTIKRTGL